MKLINISLKIWTMLILPTTHGNATVIFLWLMEFDSILHKPQNMRCFQPKDLRYRSIMDIKERDLTECFPEIYGKKSHRILIIILSSSLIVLIGLIFYLIRYPASWLVTKGIVGPNSPYNLASSSGN
ncbi:hypothetical protein NQ317_019890 [Molorchus minor]|uniref:Uncharacterized protein n=1 Tax=Molorchus minor TaxID=1323400 RepID=A0ABQ9J9K3_9CUCU|nr:hypothetical protein NQ317_019890 [Molorchus minor]